MADSDAPEAAEWVAGEIERLRGLSFKDLEAMEGRPEHRPMRTEAGKPLMLETQIFWDDRAQTNLRVMVDVWNPAKRISIGSIAKDDFIRAGTDRSSASRSARRPFAQPVPWPSP
jgi:hypothetical protein